ncbi:MAG: UDP-N-acetylmuramoyl-L-alanine--D-glutamate ligase [Muribaculaceae bacterium]|nr:UDP-N-acetylmuramoyl-L-alanine--D-glutamate ligase [Alistipes senegalensis]MCM1472688.1 UDP-N-acetylmuramoyl-L-alanine--D-glutamate ligase [Muribaculaceae bacterium]
MNKFIEYLKNYTDNKSICILGFGREGKSTYRLIEKYCTPESVTIADLNPLNNPPENVRIITGENYQKSLDDFDIVFKSPGIVLEKNPTYLKCEITSETQVFFTVYREQIIGITGTKGKSTVSSLIYHILKASGKDTYLVGNIGVPVFDIAEDVKEHTIIVCELSCHQLEYMTVSPTTAVFLNLYEEHLDHYGTMENYYNAKKNIYLHQEEYDCLLINSDIGTGYTQAAYEYTISAENPDADIYVYSGIPGKIHIHYTSGYDSINIPTDNIKLLGVHNHYNIAVAYFVTSFHVEREEIEKALITFNPLAHRLEYVDTVDGVRYYDDSISTACATAIEAIKSVPNAETILIGGMDRGIDYMPLIEFLNTCQVNVICMETSGKRIYDTIKNIDFNNPERVYYVQHLDEAVKLAHEITSSGKSCVMSPASASYGIFKNFEERGDVFKKLIAGLKNE